MQNEISIDRHFAFMCFESEIKTEKFLFYYN